VTGIIWNKAEEMNEARARVVVGAHGFYSTVAKAAGPTYESQIPVQRCMYYTYFHGLESLEDTAFADHHFVGDSLTYVFPTDADLTLVTLSVPIDEFPSFKKEPLKRMRSHLDSLPLLAPRLRSVNIAAEVKGAGNILGYQRIPYGPGWALVGNAHQIMGPWSGMGIDHATTHAPMLADSLHRFLNGDEAWDAPIGEYHSKVRNWSGKSYRPTTTFAADLRPMARGALQKCALG